MSRFEKIQRQFSGAGFMVVSHWTVGTRFETRDSSPLINSSPHSLLEITTLEGRPMSWKYGLWRGLVGRED